MAFNRINLLVINDRVVGVAWNYLQKELGTKNGSAVWSAPLPIFLQMISQGPPGEKYVNE